MSGNDSSRPSVSSVLALCRSLGVLALFVPLSAMLACTPMMKVIAGAAAWVALITGLRGVRAARAELAMARRAAWVLPAAWIAVAAEFGQRLPRWTGVPGPVGVTTGVIMLALMGGVAMMLRDMARLCARLELHQIAGRWRAVSWAWWMVYVAGFGAMMAIALPRYLAGRPVNIMLPSGVEWMLIVAAVITLAPSLMLWAAVQRTGTALGPSVARCPQCGYSRAGLPRNRCPECGAFLEPALEEGGPFGPETVPPPRLLRLAVWPAALVALVTGLGGVIDIETGGVKWRPGWMLVRDAEETVKLGQLTGGRKMLAGFLSPPPKGQTKWFSNSAEAAQSELLARLKAGAAPMPVVHRIIRTALAVQRDETCEMGEWAELFTQCYRLGFVNREALETFLLGSMRWELNARPVVMEGDPIPFELRYTWRGPGDGGPLPSDNALTQMLRPQLESLRLGGADVGSPPAPETFIPHAGGVGRGGWFSFERPADIKGWQPPLANAAPGEHRFEVSFTLVPRAGWERLWPTIPEDPVGYRVPQRLVLSAPVTVVGKGASVTSTAVSAAMRSTIATAMGARISTGFGESGELWLSTERTLPAAAQDMAFDVIVVVKDQEFVAGPVAIGADWMRSVRLPMPPELKLALRDVIPAESDERPGRRPVARDPKVRVLLRPSDAAARATIGAMHILEGGDIELESVDVR